MTSANDAPRRYQIRVQGTLDPEWGAWLDGAETSYEEKVTVLTCSPVDQAALQGLLRRLYSLGLTLISVNPVER